MHASYFQLGARRAKSLVHGSEQALRLLLRRPLPGWEGLKFWERAPKNLQKVGLAQHQLFVLHTGTRFKLLVRNRLLVFRILGNVGHRRRQRCARLAPCHGLFARRRDMACRPTAPTISAQAAAHGARNHRGHRALRGPVASRSRGRLRCRCPRLAGGGCGLHPLETAVCRLRLSAITNRGVAEPLQRSRGLHRLCHWGCTCHSPPPASTRSSARYQIASIGRR